MPRVPSVVKHRILALKPDPKVVSRVQAGCLPLGRGEALCTAAPYPGHPGGCGGGGDPHGQARGRGAHPSIRDRPLLRGGRGGAGGAPGHQRPQEPTGVHLQASEGHQLVSISPHKATILPPPSGKPAKDPAVKVVKANPSLSFVFLAHFMCYRYPPPPGGYIMTVSTPPAG